MATTKVGLTHDPRKTKPWVVRWFGEYDPATEKERRYSKSFKLKRDAVQYQAAKQAEFDKGGQRDRPAEITVREFCREYQDRRGHEWAEKTRLQVVGFCTRLMDHFGADASLRSITPSRAAKFWSKAKRLDPKGEDVELTKSSRNCLLRYAKTMFRYAVDWGHLARNPFQGIRLIRVGRRNRRRWHYLQPWEYMKLLRVAPTLRWKVILALAYTSAARFGELFNLTEDCIDFERGKLLIRNHEGTADLPPFDIKDHEEREVPLPRHVLRLLAGWLRVRPEGSPFILLTPERYALVRERWQAYRKAGKPWMNDLMVNNVVRDIRSHADRAGLVLDGALTMHCFRKSCGQNWANHLPMNVVKELMGHADISTTAEFYSTVTEEHEAQAQHVIEAITVGGSKNDARVTPKLRISPVRRAG